MGQFSVEKPVLPGSVLSGNQQTYVREAPLIWFGRARRLSQSSSELTPERKSLSSWISVSGSGRVSGTRYSHGGEDRIVRRNRSFGFGASSRRAKNFA